MRKSSKVKIGAVIEGTFRHTYHVESDEKSPVGLSGLTKEWEKFLQTSGLPKEEILKHPEVVLGILSKYAKALEIGDIDCLYTSKQENKTKEQSFYKESKTVIPFPSAKEFEVEELTFEKIVKQNVDLNSVYPVRKKIGEGGAGSVYVTTTKTSENTEKLIALKVLYNIQEENKSLVNEIAMMKLCQSCNQIVHFYDAFMVKDGFAKSLWIAMEYMPGGCLYDLLKSCKKIPDTVTAYVMREMLLGLEFLHRRHRIHRDIKSDNVLLSLEGDLKLADFGNCTQLTEEEQLRKTATGTPFWMAPEVIMAGMPSEDKIAGMPSEDKMADSSGYSVAADIWSLGITAIECAEGKPPHMDCPPFRALFLISSSPPPILQHPEEHSPLLVQFLECCLQTDPSKRWSAGKLLAHPFISLACGKDTIVPFIMKSRDKNAKYV